MGITFLNYESKINETEENTLTCDSCLFNLSGECNCECESGFDDLDEITDEFEDESLKFIWGLLSYDDLSSFSKANLYTMNDCELIYWKESKTYSFSIETAFTFDTNKDKINYLEEILKQFTKWMIDNHYKIDEPPFLPDVFSYSQNMNSHFYKIEDCYTNFKLFVKGFISCITEKDPE